jgi:hypothetical protein
MTEDRKKLSDAERKKAEEHSRRFTKWLREGIVSDPQESPQESTETKKPLPPEAA